MYVCEHVCATDMWQSGDKLFSLSCGSQDLIDVPSLGGRGLLSFEPTHGQEAISENSVLGKLVIFSANSFTNSVLASGV